MDTVDGVLAQRLREARERMGLTQKQLADAAGFPAHQIVSQIEKGERQVKAWELARMAKILAVSLYDLLGPEVIVRPRVLWRQSPQENGPLKESRLIERYKRFCFIQEVTGFQSHIRPPRIDMPIRSLSYREVNQFAEAIRKAFELGSRPAFALMQVAEAQFGIQIWYDSLGDDGSAASLVDVNGAAVLLNSDEVPWRRNYSFAHELFHVLTWDDAQVAAIQADTQLFDHNERMANAFASALLLPSDSVQAELIKACKDEQLQYADLVAIAGDFGVSTSALLWRLVNMHIMEWEGVQAALKDPELQAVDAASRKRDRRRPPNLPERFVRLSWLAWQLGHLSRGRLAEYLETHLVDLDDVLTEYGLSEAEFSPNEAVELALSGIMGCLSVEEESSAAHSS